MGQQILKVALVANEAIESMKRRKEIDILCKLDIEEACNHVR